MKCKELKRLRKLNKKLTKKIIRTGNPTVKLKKNNKELCDLTNKYRIMMMKFLND